MALNRLSVCRTYAVTAAALLLLAAAPEPPVQITGAWARATAPGQDSGAAYLNITVTNPDKLLSAASPQAKSAMLHQTTHAGSMSAMKDMQARSRPSAPSPSPRAERTLCTPARSTASPPAPTCN